MSAVEETSMIWTKCLEIRISFMYIEKMWQQGILANNIEYK
jgi:hypothetical protein